MKRKPYAVILALFLWTNVWAIGLQDMSNNNLYIECNQEKIDSPTKPKLPKYSINAGVGFGYILKVAGGDEYGISNSLRKGLDWNAAFYRYYNGLGWGILYEDFRSSVYKKTSHIRVDDVHRLTYFAPQVSGIHLLAERWLLHCEAGVGWLRYKENSANWQYKVSASSNAVGSNLGVGCGYMLSPMIAIGLDINILGGLFKNLKIDNSNYPIDEKLSGKGKWGSWRINCGLKIRVNLGH